jgi:GDPmannose 4,6-dehydratase
MKKALITGVTGQDGSYLAEFLLQKGYEVHGVRRKNSTDNTLNIDYILNSKKISDNRFFLHYGDITDNTSLIEIISKQSFDEVYHLSAQSHVHTSFLIPEYTTSVNALGSMKILEVLKKFSSETKFYNASTSELFGKVLEPIQNEKTPFNPVSPYSISKLFCHLMTKNYKEAYGMFTCSGILFNHESPRRGLSFVSRKITQSVSKIKLGLEDKLTLGNLYSKRDWGFAKEYVEAMWLMLQNKFPADYVIGTGKNYSIKDFVEKSFNHLGISLAWEGSGLKEVGINIDNNKVVVDIDKYYYRPAEVDELLADPSKAKKELNWSHKTDLDKLVSMMIENDYNFFKNKI